MSDVPLESGMATGSDEGTPGEHVGDSPDAVAASALSPAAASDEVMAAVEDDAPLPAEGGDEGDPDTPVFREP